MKNTLKKSEIFGAIFVMVFGTLMHFFYDWSGKNPVVAFVCSVQRIHLGTLEAIVFPCFDLFGFSNMRISGNNIRAILPEDLQES